MKQKRKSAHIRFDRQMVIGNLKLCSVVARKRDTSNFVPITCKRYKSKRHVWFVRHLKWACPYKTQFNLRSEPPGCRGLARVVSASAFPRSFKIGTGSNPATATFRSSASTQIHSIKGETQTWARPKVDQKETSAQRRVGRVDFHSTLKSAPQYGTNRRPN
jgi:hypothetical protein